MYKASIILALSLLTSCNKPVDTAYIKKHEWKYGSGDGWVGDWLFFSGGSYKISHDTLFKRDTARAIILSLDKNGFKGDNEMEIKLLENGKIGIYHQKK